jgi:iron complex outermembrane receptor protein
VFTTTKGVDVVLNWPWTAGNAGRFDFTLAGSYTDTEVTKLPATAQLSALPSAPVLFGRVNTLTLEQGQPKDKITASANWRLGGAGATLRATRYGKVLSPNVNPAADNSSPPSVIAALDQRLSAKTLVDLEGRYALTRQFTLALGAENLFDQYPDPVSPAVNPSGNAPFPNYSPFGRSGRYVYARANYAF